MGTSRIEIGAGFLMTSLSGFDVLHSYIANAIILVLGLALIGHGAYDILKPKLFLKRTVAHWLGIRGWVVKYVEGYPAMYFAMEIRQIEHRDWPISVAHSKDTKGVITFSSALPLEPMAGQLSRLPGTQQQLLVLELRKTLEIMGVGFDPLIWPLQSARLQTSVPADGLVSEHVVNGGAVKLLNALLACRAIIQQAIVQSIDDTPKESQPPTS